MAAQDWNDSSQQNRVRCTCKSTCSTKRTRSGNRGCPCKTEGVICGPHCKCGSEAKPCRNKQQNEGTRPQPRRQPSNYRVERDRPSEEAERIKENRDVKDFINTLDDPMVRKLCVRSL
ncbi:uncharacterized protein [Montipora capricornis]|uniref:uncharacterized protein n=1 Tax=Montipora capricornis TaxID=246305 RepID=UPI0035F146EB